MAARYKRKTKNFFIKKDMQGRFVLAIFLAVIGGCLTFLLLLGLFSADTMTISYTDNDIQVGATPWMLLKNAVAANWIFLVICGTFLVAASMIATHRIAGPLFRFEKALTMMAEGNLADTIYLRGNDEGKDLAEKINQFNTIMCEKLTAMDRHSEAISDLLARYESLDSTTISLEDAANICQAIKNHNEKLRKQIGYFTIGNE